MSSVTDLLVEYELEGLIDQVDELKEASEMLHVLMTELIKSDAHAELKKVLTQYAAGLDVLIAYAEKIDD